MTCRTFTADVDTILASMGADLSLYAVWVWVALDDRPLPPASQLVKRAAALSTKAAEHVPPDWPRAQSKTRTLHGERQQAKVTQR